MTYRDLRYLRLGTTDLDGAARFSADIFGLMPADRSDDVAMFRSDARDYAICWAAAGTDLARPAVALTVALEADLAAAGARLAQHGFAPGPLEGAAAARRNIKKGLSVTAPNGVAVEIVWRPLASGWPYHGSRDTGITGFQSIALCSTDIAADEAFWTDAMGLRVTDWAGDAVFLAFDEAHHRIALYPSARDGILGATWAVSHHDYVMRNWYHLQKHQIPVAAGPGRQPTSNAMFITARGPEGLLMSYAAETESGPQIAARGPRQFADTALSHCAWGSATDIPEFLGRSAR